MLLFCIFFGFIGHASENGIHLTEYQNVAIATDLEPDDVLALKLIFQEANHLYAQHPENGYPIKLVVVGEGNAAIKKLRMEKMLKDYFSVPVKVEVKEGKSTSDNIFPYDGEELFSKDKLRNIPYPKSEDGTNALITFTKESENPLIIQIKPVQELITLSSNRELAKKATVIFYGSFNFRKSLNDKEVIDYFHFSPDTPLQFKLQTLLDHLSKSFKKLGIVESFGVLGEESSVYFKYPWSQLIAACIEHSHEPFYSMFKQLVHNWNKYLLEVELTDMTKSINELMVLFPQKKEALENIHKQLDSLHTSWDENKFTSVFDEINSLRLSGDSPESKRVLEQLNRDLNFANQLRPSAGIQFTLSDVIVALALGDTGHFFTATPVKVQVNERGFLQTTPEANSNVFYYDRKDHKKFVEIIMPKLSEQQPCHFGD
jgi:hypothetical protein